MWCGARPAGLDSTRGTPRAQYSAAAGAFVHASDWSSDLAPLSNLAAHSGVAARPTSQQKQQKQKQQKLDDEKRKKDLKKAKGGGSVAAPAEPAHTVAFLMSDGDNLCWLQGAWALDPKWCAIAHSLLSSLPKIPAGRCMAHVHVLAPRPTA
jgi:hypothetical protein